MSPGLKTKKTKTRLEWLRGDFMLTFCCGSRTGCGEERERLGGRVFIYRPDVVCLLSLCVVKYSCLLVTLFN